MLFIRWIKRSAHLNRETKRYIAYAAGEMLLVVAGILIALQIDNWNSERREQATIDHYLHAIARSMREDLLSLEELTTSRSATLLLTRTARSDLTDRLVFGVDEIFYLNRAVRAAEAVTYFNASRGAYDALMVSGVLDKLQGLDVEPLLSRYYQGALRISQMEEAYNAHILALDPEVNVDRADGEFLEPFAVYDPSALAPGRVAELQDYYRRYFNSSYIRRLFANAYDAAPLLREYWRQVTLARLYIEALESGRIRSNPDIARVLREQDAIAAGAAPAELVRDGRAEQGFIRPEFGASFFDGSGATRTTYIGQDYVREVDDSLRLSYRGGAAWALFMFEAVERSNTLGRPSMDFSGFDRVRLEMRGAQGGERLLVHMKDSSDADDGQQTNIEVVLSDQWENYEYELADFVTADPSALNTVIGFLMIGQAEPLVFDIRTLRFLRPGE